MNKKIAINILLILTFIAVSIFISSQILLSENDPKHEKSDHHVEEPEKGPNGGKLFRNDDQV